MSHNIVHSFNGRLWTSRGLWRFLRAKISARCYESKQLPQFHRSAIDSLMRYIPFPKPRKEKKIRASTMQVLDVTKISVLTDATPMPKPPQSV